MIQDDEVMNIFTHSGPEAAGRGSKLLSPLPVRHISNERVHKAHRSC